MKGKGRQDGGKLNIVVANKREGGEKRELYLCVNVFSTKALTGDTIFTSPNLVFMRHVTILSRQDSLDPVVYRHLKFLNCLTVVDGGLQTS